MIATRERNTLGPLILSGIAPEISDLGHQLPDINLHLHHAICVRASPIYSQPPALRHHPRS
ncbi:hypothetical protein BDV59DRAFT_174346 [Aspergillus ambiguus]|uniref:uncharacterized protein n=1 Tax=Aspergillus ambiguus TaxID=176160 RepID=UPI003CCD60E0